MGCGSQKPPEGGRGVLTAEPLPRPRGHGHPGPAEPGPEFVWGVGGSWCRQSLDQAGIQQAINALGMERMKISKGTPGSASFVRAPKAAHVTS